MPWIEKKNKSTNKVPTEKELLRKKLYNNTQWRKLRQSYIMEHPICELCGKELATDCHHLSSPFNDGLSDIERIGRLLDASNLQALCKECHCRLHGNVHK